MEWWATSSNQLADDAQQHDKRERVSEAKEKLAVCNLAGDGARVQVGTRTAANYAACLQLRVICDISTILAFSGSLQERTFGQWPCL
jgi:hypothetical protein